MKNLVVIAMAMVASVVIAAETPKTMPLSEARAQIQKVIANKSEMTSVMRKLSPADQKTFVAEVIAAISKLPGSPEERTAMIINVTRGALAGAAKGNVTAITAEVFATVPTGSLPAVTEYLSEHVFNRATDKKNTYTDSKYIKIVQNVMKTANERLVTAEDSGVRAGFVGLMMIKASNSESMEIQNAVVAELPQNVKKTASEKWYPSALATGDSKSYEPMLGVADGEVSRPVTEMVLRISGPQTSESLLADISGANTDTALNAGEVNPVVDAVQSPIVYELPNLGNGGANATVPSKEQIETHGYQYQTTGA